MANARRSSASTDCRRGTRELSVEVYEVADDDEAREVAATLNADRRHIPSEQRKQIVAALREAGHSLRANAGRQASQTQVARDLAATVTPVTVPETVTGLDGKVRPSTRPKPTVAPERTAEQTVEAWQEFAAEIIQEAAAVEALPAPKPSKLQASSPEDLQSAAAASVGQPSSPRNESSELQAWEDALRDANNAAKTIRGLPPVPSDVDRLFCLAAQDVARLLVDASARIIDQLPTDKPSIRRVK